MGKNMIATGDWEKFLNLKDEELVLVIRQHPFTVIMPILVVGALAFILITTAISAHLHFFYSPTLLTLAVLTIISSALGVATKIIIDWYFHVYMLTNRKMLEFRYTPLMSYVVNDVMLDRVYCTEIDLHTKGWLNDILDIGDVILTFDRPTHQEEFILKDIISSNKIGNYLIEHLLDRYPPMPLPPMWFNTRHAGGRS